MMRKRFGVLVALVMMATAPAAHAQGTGPTIGQVRGYCAEWDKTDFSQIKDPFLAGFCLGLVQAFRDGVTVGLASTLSFFKDKVARDGPEGRTGYERWCPPVGVTNQHLAGVFMSWSSENPKSWRLPYSIGFFDAFRTEWPCGQEEAPPAIEQETGSPDGGK